jgi:hypothetical protein
MLVCEVFVTNRSLLWLWALVALCGVPTACGARAEMDGRGPEPCPGWDLNFEPGTTCTWQWVEPSPPYPGATAVPPCEIQMTSRYFNPNQVAVYVDCEPIPRDVLAGYAQEYWRFDDLVSPTTIIMNETLCSRLQEERSARIDVLYGCTPLPIE